MSMTHDIAVIGAGIAGGTAAAHLSAERRVALIEAEDAAGYHTTGRSAALWIQNYGPPDVRVLSGLSRRFFENPPAGFTETGLMSQRSVVLLATHGQEAALRSAIDTGIGLRHAEAAEIEAWVPALRQDYLIGAAVEQDAFDMDVAALHQGFLRQHRAQGGTLALRARTGRIERQGGLWHVATTTGEAFAARTLVNAAGAWADEVALQAGAAPIGLQPKRRTACIVDPAPHAVAAWPMLIDIGEAWYARPEARTRLLVSPADETPTHPHDVQPEEIDVATGIHRMQQALDIEVRRVERAWAGLRSFSPDGSLAFGWDASVEGFFWFAGQGGYGIQTSPAAGRLAADLILGRDPGAAGAIIERIDPARFAMLTA